MTKFKVWIEETCSQDFEVEANDEDEAMDIAIEKYKNGEFVLEPGNLESKTMMIENTETDEQTNWIDF